MNQYPRSPDNQRVPLPFVPPRPVSDVTLSQHVADKNDPHETLKQVNQVRIVAFLPGDLTQYNGGDLVIVHTTGLCYRVVVDAGGSKSLKNIPFQFAAPLDGKEFSLRTDDEKTFALGSIIESLGGQARV